KTSAAAVEEAVRIMETLNRAAAEAMIEVGVHAATDVTGFGLLGHLREMTAGSRVRARLQYASVPVLEEARSLVRQGAVAGGTAGPGSQPRGPHWRDHRGSRRPD